MDDKTIYWKECTSKNGNKFEVGYLNEDDSLNNEMLRASSDTKNPFTMVVNWALTDPEVWTNTTNSERDESAITRYSVGKSSNPLYSYHLRFTNLKHYDYYFVDETGDQYEVNCFSNSNHFVRYNSSNPTIVYVKGD